MANLMPFRTTSGRLLAAGLALLGLAATAATVAAAEPARVALVVGQSAYQQAPTLPNAVNDASAMAAALEKLGFQTELGLDLDKSGLDQAIRRLANRSATAETALFYYAGHGLQVNGVNYLVPVDARLDHVRDISAETVDAGLALRVMEPARKARLVILDACRDNPLVGRRDAPAVARSVGQGLAAMDAAVGQGTLVAFSTEPGNVSLDGEGRHSPFTNALLATIAEPGLEIRQVLTRARQRVLEETRGKQTPWDNSSLTEDVFLAEGPASAASDRTAGSPAAAQDEVRYWQSIMASRRPEDFAEYLRRFPNGTFSGLAGRRMAAVESTAEPALVRRAPPVNGTEYAALPAPAGNLVRSAATNPQPATSVTSAGDTLPVPNGAVVRSAPSPQAERLVTLPPGVLVKVTGRTPGGEWLAVDLGAGRTGFVTGDRLGQAPAGRPGT